MVKTKQCDATSNMEERKCIAKTCKEHSKPEHSRKSTDPTKPPRTTKIEGQSLETKRARSTSHHHKTTGQPIDWADKLNPPRPTPDPSTGWEGEGTGSKQGIQIPDLQKKQNQKQRAKTKPPKPNNKTPSQVKEKGKRNRKRKREQRREGRSGLESRKEKGREEGGNAEATHPQRGWQLSLQN